MEAHHIIPFTESLNNDYSNIIFTAALGFMLFGQFPDVWSILGFVLIVAAAFRLHRG